MKRRFLIIVFIAPLLSLSQVPFYVDFERFDEGKGLSSPIVFRVFQDFKGLVWMGTDYGLNSYDGHRITSYIFNDTVNQNSVLAIDNFSDSSLIISYYKEGLFEFGNGRLRLLSSDPISQKVLRIEHLGDQFYFVNDGKAWAAMKENLKDPIEDYYIHEKGLLDALVKNDEGDIYIATGKSIHKRNQSTYRKVLDLSEPSRSGQIRNIARGKGKQLYFAMDKEIHVFEDEGSRVISTSSDGSNITQVLVDSEDRIWYCTEAKRLFCFTKGIHIDISARINLKKTYITQLTEDNEGNIWIATYGEGCYRIKLHENIFAHDVQDFTGSTGLGNFTPMDNKMMFTNENTVLGIRYNGNELTNATSTELPALVSALMPVKDSILVATRGELLLCDVDLNQCRQLMPEYILSATKLSDGTILLGLYDGVSLTDSSFNILPSDPYHILTGKRVNEALEDQAGTVWVATDKGLYFKMKNSPKMVTESTFGHSTIHAMHLSSHGGLWVASAKGVWHKTEGNVWKQLKTPDGLETKYLVTSIAEDHLNRLWLGTKSGLRCISLQDSVFLSQEVISEKPDIRTLYYDADSLLWVGAFSSVYRIDPADFSAPVHLIPGLVWNNDEEFFELLPGDENTKLQFRGISPSYHSDIIYKYRLVEHDTAWNMTSSNFATLHDLNPGEYTFEVRARFKFSDQWSPGISKKILVRKPFWMQPHFLIPVLTLTLTLLTTTLLWFRIRRKRSKKQSRETEQQIKDLKHQLINSMLNPHFIFNALNSITGNPGYNTDRYVADLAKLVRMNFDSSKKVLIALDEEIERLKLYLRVVNAQHRNCIHYQLNIDEGIDTYEYQVPNMLLQPFVENAIWHGILPKRKGHISIDIKRKDSSLEFYIDDDGPGLRSMDEEFENKDRGPRAIQLTKERIELLSEINELKIYNLKDPANRITGARTYIRLEYDPETCELMQTPVSQ